MNGVYMTFKNYLYVFIIFIQYTSLSSTMELQKEGKSASTAEPLVTLINNDSETIKLPLSLALQSSILKLLYEEQPNEHEFPVGSLHYAQLHFIKKYLKDRATLSSDRLISNLTKMNLEQLSDGLNAANFLNIKSKKPIIAALTARLTCDTEIDNLFTKGTCSVSIPEELLHKIRKQYARYPMLSHWLAQAQILKHKGKLPSTSWKYPYGMDGIRYNSTGTKTAEWNKKKIAIRNLATHQVQWLSAHNDTINGLTWSPCGTKIASASEDQTIKIWDTTNQTCITTLPGYHASHLA